MAPDFSSMGQASNKGLTSTSTMPPPMPHSTEENRMAPYEKPSIEVRRARVRKPPTTKPCERTRAVR